LGRKDPPMSDLRIGIVISTDGSAFRSAFEILKKTRLDTTFFVALDRKTDLIDYCIAEKISFVIFEGLDNENFSAQVSDYFKKSDVTFCLLFFSRLVTKELFEEIESINIHPSLLPKFPGMNAIADFCNSKDDLFGLTAHQVDSGVDTGPKLLQVSLKYQGPRSVDLLQPIAYLQKVLVTLLIIDYRLHTVNIEVRHDNFCFLDHTLEESFRSYFENNMLVKYLSDMVISRYDRGYE
jgi:phosphoribosylglycinamide formyltransferase 1